MINKVYRPTSMGLAFVDAAVKAGTKGTKQWVVRRVVMNAEHTKIGVTADVSGNAKLKFSTAKKLQAAGIL